jgi:GAF domain-containing protein
VWTHVTGPIANWLNRPQRTRRDDLSVGLVLVGLVYVLTYGLGRGLDALGLIDFGNDVPLWLAALAIVFALLAGIFVGRRSYTSAPQTYELYAEHLRDALADLRRVKEDELETFSLRDYVENGIFQGAHRLLTTHGRARGDVRFSILHPSKDDPDVFVMSEDGVLFPALGHSIEARQEFSIRIDDSFVGQAYRSAKTAVSNDVQHDSRWKAHPRARPGREYGSLVAVPLVSRGRVNGVLGVIAVRPRAFRPVEQTYITLLGSVIDVARTIPEN